MRKILATSLLFVFLGCCMFAVLPKVEGASFSSVLASNNLTSFASLLQSSGLINTLQNGSAFTVFAPSNDALSAVGTTLPSGAAPLNSLGYHVTPGTVTTSSFVNDKNYPTLATSGWNFVRLNNYSNGVDTVNGASVINPNLKVDNGGIIQVINQVLIAPNRTITQGVSNDSSLSSLSAALTASGLDNPLDNTSDVYTLFAPSNDAFNRLPLSVSNALQNNATLLNQVLSYNILYTAVYPAGISNNLTEPSLLNNLPLTFTTTPSSKASNLQFVNGVLLGNSENFENGLLYHTDSLLIPPLSPAELNTLFNNTIFNSSLTTAGLLALLNRPNTTIFAPDDLGFSQLSPSLQQSIGSNSTLLSNVLSYHFVDGDHPFSSLSNDLLLPTLFSGNNLRINVYNGSIYTANGKVITNGVGTNNGGFYYNVNGVLIPPTMTIYQYLASNSSLSDAFTAVQFANLTTLLSDPAQNLTAFIPDNDAFNRAGINVNNTAASTLRSILLYNILGSTFYTPGLLTGSYPTLNGQSLSVSNNGSGGIVLNNNVNLIEPDINEKNGVVHITDNVLIPSNLATTSQSSSTVVTETTETNVVATTQETIQTTVETTVVETTVGAAESLHYSVGLFSLAIACLI